MTVVQAILGVSWFQKAQSGAIPSPLPRHSCFLSLMQTRGQSERSFKGFTFMPPLSCPVPGTATVNGYKRRGLRPHTGISPSSGSEKHGAKVGSGMGPPEGCISASHLLPAPGIARDLGYPPRADAENCALSAPSFSSPPSPSSSDNKMTRMRLWSQLN